MLLRLRFCPCWMACRQQVAADNERLRQLQEAEAACEAEATAAARAIEYRNELRHRLDIQVMQYVVTVVSLVHIVLGCLTLALHADTNQQLDTGCAVTGHLSIK